MQKITNVFVVTRDGRRIEDINYALKSNAWDRANALMKSFKLLRLLPGDIKVEEVARPNKIW
jgi:hypothetical protein